jgi:hypothetical protein
MVRDAINARQQTSRLTSDVAAPGQGVAVLNQQVVAVEFLVALMQGIEIGQRRLMTDKEIGDQRTARRRDRGSWSGQQSVRRG